MAAPAQRTTEAPRSRAQPPVGRAPRAAARAREQEQPALLSRQAPSRAHEISISGANADGASCEELIVEGLALLEEPQFSAASLRSTSLPFLALGPLETRACSRFRTPIDGP